MMKNYTTPRTMSEAHINASYDPIERLTRNDMADAVVVVACAIAAVAAFAIIMILG